MASHIWGDHTLLLIILDLGITQWTIVRFTNHSKGQSPNDLMIGLAQIQQIRI